MPTVREYETALQRNPADTEAFVALRKAYRQAQKHDKLVTLYETRAQAIEDGPKAAELFYLAAELRIDQLGDAEGARGRSGQRRRPRRQPHPRGGAPEGHLSRAGPHRGLHDDAGDGGGGGRAHARSGAHRRAAVGDGPAVREPLREAGKERPQRAAPRQAEPGQRQVDRVGAQDLPRARRLPRGGAPLRAGAGGDDRGQAPRRPVPGPRARARARSSRSSTPPRSAWAR